MSDRYRMTRFAFALAAFIPTQAVAQMSDQSGRVEFCNDWAEFATIQMKIRQEGVPFTKALNWAGDSARTELEFKMATHIVRMAYNRDLARTYRGIEVAIIEFSEDVFLGCVSD